MNRTDEKMTHSVLDAENIYHYFVELPVQAQWRLVIYGEVKNKQNSSYQLSLQCPEFGGPGIEACENCCFLCEVLLSRHWESEMIIDESKTEEHLEGSRMTGGSLTSRIPQNQHRSNGPE